MCTVTVAAFQGEIATVKFAECQQKCFCSHESLNTNISSVTMIKQTQSEVKNLPTLLM